MTVDSPRAHLGRDTARRVVPLFRPYRGQVTVVVGLIVLTSSIGIANPLRKGKYSGLEQQDRTIIG